MKVAGRESYGGRSRVGRFQASPAARGALGGAGATLCSVPLALTTLSFDVLRSVVFFYIKSPLRVEEAGLQELIPTTWWPHRSSKEVGLALPRLPRALRVEQAHQGASGLLSRICLAASWLSLHLHPLPLPRVEKVRRCTRQLRSG